MSRVMAILGVTALLLWGCMPEAPKEGCTSHAACPAFEGREARCTQSLEAPDGFQCRPHCVDDKACQETERCVQMECITPDQDCFGACLPLPGPCEPACDKGQVCRDGRCADAPVTNQCEGELTTRPTLRSETMGVYDVKRKRLVMFGGDLRVPVDCDIAPPLPFGANDLWVYDTACTTFARASYTGTPQPRSRGVAIYNQTKDQMLLFGGRFRAAKEGKYQRFNDAWTLNLETLAWAPIETKGTRPFSRSGHVGVLDEKNQALLIFGGDGSDTEFQFLPRNDLWSLSLKTNEWKELVVTGDKPTPRMLHAAAWDEKGQRLFIYGGGDRDLFIGPFLNDLWMWSRATGAWALLHDGKTGDKATIPSRRIGATMTYDVHDDRLVLFGGQDDSSLGNNNSTWAFSIKDKQWEVLTKAETIHTPADNFCKYRPGYTVPNMDAPDRRATHFAVLDKARREWLVFGGKTDCGIIDDLWSFDLQRNEWIRIKPATQGESCFRGSNPNLCKTLCK